MRTSLLASAAAVALLIIPASASAAPAATLNLADGGTPSYAWTGGPGNGILPGFADLVGAGPVSSDSTFGCGKPGGEDCEDTLIKVDDEGDLTFDLQGDPGSATDQNQDYVRLDLDAFLYQSDANGTIGDEVANSTSEYATESAVASDVTPGYYVARVVFYEAYQATYHAKATLTPFVPFDEE